jgi:hypothetical protein
MKVVVLLAIRHPMTQDTKMTLPANRNGIYALVYDVWTSYIRTGWEISFAEIRCSISAGLQQETPSRGNDYTWNTRNVRFLVSTNLPETNLRD